MPRPTNGQLPLYTGTWDCAVKTVKREGFKGFYKGNLFNYLIKIKNDYRVVTYKFFSNSLL